MKDNEGNYKTTAAENWQRYEYGISRGHREYTETAKLLEGFYLGGGYDKDGILLPGGHYNEADLAALSVARRPAYEFNQVKPAVDAAIGYQINNRMDISFRPRSKDATKEAAEIRSRVAMQIADNCQLHWLETDVFTDGMIQQRGYYDCRMDFEDSVDGELKISVLDCMDVIPDPDAKTYDPRGWSDVIITRWLTLDEIEGLYGLKVRKEAEANATGGSYVDKEYGEDADGERRNSFGTQDRYDSTYTASKVQRFRIIDRQRYIKTLMDVAISPEGDIRQITGDEMPDVLEGQIANGWKITKRRMKRVRWTVSTYDTMLHDEWSPYDRFTVGPFFPYFRRGKTRGMVDNAVGPSQALDKGISQAIHIINTTANAGWQMEQDQLHDMTRSDLEDYGATSGIVIERKKGTAPIEKIKANEMPRGVAELIGLANQTIQDVTVPDAMRGIAAGMESGIAIQSRQHASQQILAVPLDNLSRSRHYLAGWIDYAISKYYTTERVVKITKENPFTGQEDSEDLVINEFDPETGQYLNDMTAGEYDVVVVDQPMQITFDNSQFEQITTMRKEMSVAIPDSVVVKHSNLSDKHEIIAAMDSQAQPPEDPTIKAKVGLIEAQTRKADADAVTKNIEGLFSSVETAQNIAVYPELAPIADQVAKSAGFEDQDEEPIIDGGGLEPMEIDEGMENTNPLTPVNPAVGMTEGIEGGGEDVAM